MVADPLDPAIVLLVEQRGVVRVARAGELQAAAFLDLQDAVVSGGEQGLLGLAIDPRRGRVFVNFTNREGHTVVARFGRSADDPLVADLSSRHDFVWPDGRAFIKQPFSNHNGGHLAFGPDGYLYVGLGDGGSGGDPMHLAQDARSLLGKMLRLDVDVPDEDERGYRVPADNPFGAGQPVAAHGEIWAFGLRNPWRFSFDDLARGGTGALLIGDVGQGAREEVNYQAAGVGGLNYGWRLREGTAAYDDRRPAAYQPLTDPIHDYPRSDGQSITGGYVYRGSALDPAFAGRYFFADFIAGRVWSLAFEGSDAPVPMARDLRDHSEALFGRSEGLISSFGVDADGELHVLDYQAGTVLKIVPDLALVPDAPRGLAVAADGDRVTLTWTAPETGVMATGYLIETLATERSAPLRRVEAGERGGVLSLAPDEACVRARATGRSGAGPATPPFCVPRP